MVTPDECLKLPKVEMHAHLTPSASKKTLDKLIAWKMENRCKEDFTNYQLVYSKSESGTLSDVFKLFSLVHKVSDNERAIYEITKDVIVDFVNDNVLYLELRTTLRDVPSSGMTKQSHLNTIVQAIRDSDKLPIIVRLLLSVDRGHSMDVAMEIVNMASQCKQQTGLVVGIDVCGDPAVGNVTDFIPVLQHARSLGLKTSVHLAEKPGLNQETLDFLSVFVPDRVGHLTYLHPDRGGSQKLVDIISKLQIPLEAGITSNIKCETVATVDEHQFGFWYSKGHPCTICTDDKGIFSTSLSEEYYLAAKHFHLTLADLYQLTYKSIDYIFADENNKENLRKMFSEKIPAVSSVYTVEDLLV